MSAEANILARSAEIMNVDRIGALEENDRTSLIAVDGKRMIKYLDGSEKMMMSVMLQGKDADQQALMSDMSVMISQLCRNSRSIKGENYSVQSVRLRTAPVPVLKSPLMWFYKAIFEIVYIKKE